jgi:5-methylcytosine-specific restriction endonuclease McrA
VTKTVPDDTRAALYRRSNWRCERCGVRYGSGMHVSHRKPRGMGGKRADHARLSNLNLLCAPCHLRFVEANPEAAGIRGWRVASWADPALVPVRLYDGWAFLDDAGGVMSPPFAQ